MSADWTVRTAPDASTSVDPAGVTIVALARRAGRRARQTTRATRAAPPATIATTAITDMSAAFHAGAVAGVDTRTGPLSRSLRLFPAQRRPSLASSTSW